MIIFRSLDSFLNFKSVFTAQLILARKRKRFVWLRTLTQPIRLRETPKYEFGLQEKKALVLF